MNYRNWFKYFKPGEGLASAQPEFTLTAVLLGLAIGCLICFTNLSLGLQSGWISMMSIQSALIGFLVSRMLPTPLSPQEIIVVQTTAVATGTMPLAAGFVGILPALTLLSEDRDGSPPIHLTWLGLVGWSCSVAFFGVFLSPPIRKQVIVEEQLPFPSGTATAHLISVLHKMPPPDTTVRHRAGYQAISDDEEYSRDAATHVVAVEEEIVHDAIERDSVEHEGWYDLVWSFVASGFLTLSAYFYPVLFAIPLFGNHLAKEWLWYFTPSLSYVGQGIIMGFPTTLSMNLGMLTGWAILSPLSKLSGWAPGPVGDMATGARGWILWVSLGIMCTDSLISLLPVAMDYLAEAIWPRRRNYTTIGGPDDQDKPHETETEDRLVPNTWVLSGLFISVVVGIGLVWLVFGHEGIKPWATLLGFILGGMLSIIGVRALGETDLNPVSGLGKISQLFFAWIQPGNIVANIIAGGVAEAGAQQAGDLMQDLKTGHLCHASPRAQFYGQLIGSSVSIVVTATAYSLYNRAYIIPGPSFPAPTAYVWLSLARLLRDGQLPENSAVFMAAFSLVFGLLSALKSYGVRRNSWYAKWIPSGVAFAIGFLNTPSFSIARLIGGILEYVYRTRFAQNGGDIRLIIIASGFVLGEGVMSIVSLILRTLGVGIASCFGCGHGLCGGCPAVQ
ncbi:oligopeptide transporter [Crassisporium funariophilum]|nr:oligopeptide transporter [Crassisporium funariophilum]